MMLKASLVFIIFFSGLVPCIGQQATERAQTATDSDDLESGHMRFPRYGLTAATDGSWVYVYGGAPEGGRNGKDFMHDGLHASIERIDPKTLTSTYFGNGLHRRANHATVYLNQQLVSCGGRSQVGLSRPKIASCEYLDLETGLYRELPALPEALRTLGLAAIDDDLYVFGGLIGGTVYSSNLYRLRPGGQAWESLPGAPITYSGPVVAVGKKLYTIGGYNGQSMHSVMVYDVEKATWQRHKDLPFGLSAYSAVVDGTDIYIFGDYEQMSKVHRYDTQTGDLYLLDAQITPRRHTAAVLVGEQVLVMGGNQTSSGKALSLVEALPLKMLRAGGEKVKRTKD